MTPIPNAVSVARRIPDVEDYIDMLRRYRAWIIGPMFLGLVVSTVLAFLSPDTYVSVAVMRVTPQQVPENLVPSTISLQMADRLQQMETEILSRTTLGEIIQKPSLNLYEGQRRQLPLEDIVQRMRNKDIRISPMVSVSGGGRNHLTSAFSIQFSYTDRYKAQAVVRELINKFIEQNVRFQQNQASITNDFLSSELNAAKQKMDELSAKLTKFKIENAGKLPEQAQANASALQTYRLQLMSLSQNISTLQSDKTMLESDLQNLRSRLEYVTSNLTQAAGSSALAVRNDRLVNLEKDLADANAKLAAAKELFGANHPDVIAQQAIIDALEKRRRRSNSRKPRAPRRAKPRPCFPAPTSRETSSRFEAKSTRRKRPSGISKPKLKRPHASGINWKKKSLSFRNVWMPLPSMSNSTVGC